MEVKKECRVVHHSGHMRTNGMLVVFSMKDFSFLFEFEGKENGFGRKRVDAIFVDGLAT